MRTDKVPSIGILFAMLVCVLLVMPSCAHKSPLKDKMFIQAYGGDGQFVITVNTAELDLDQYVDTSDTAINYLTQRMNRLSIVLFDKSGQYSDYPADLTAYDFDGAIEGNYSKTLLTTALKASGLFTQKSTELQNAEQQSSEQSSVQNSKTSLKFFTDEESGLQTAVPANGIILFSSDSVEASYEKVFQGSEKLISDEQASKLASCEIGIYVSNPKTMLDLGLDIPRSSLENIEYILVMLNGETLSIDFKLKSESLARSFSIIIKGSYVGQLRRAGETIDIEQLKQQFVQEFDMVSVKNLGLTQEQYEAIQAVITGLLGVFNFGGTL